MSENVTAAGVRPLTCRIAPSPTGRMHAGNVFAALVSWLVARRTGGEVVLRVEDLDPERLKPEFADQVQRDLEWLGLTWDRGPYFQSQRGEAYQAAFEALEREELVYPCFCSRADVRNATQAPHFGEKRVYPGTCRHLSPQQQAAKRAELAKEGRAPSQRLRVPDKDIEIPDLFQGAYKQNLERDCGDFLVRRADGAFAYQLAVVVDDAAMGVDCVVRGVDLLSSAPQQVYLQQLFGFPVPVYAHVPLLVAEHDRRLSKRDKDAGVGELRERFRTAEGVLGHIAHITGLIGQDTPMSADELAKAADLGALRGRVQVQWR